MKVASKVFTILLYIEIALIAVLVIASFVTRPFGYSNYMVQTASMTPTIPVGSIAYINENVDGDEIAPNDIVAFYIDDTHEKICVHRALANDAAGQLIETKGDANEALDPAPTPYSNVVGRCDLTIPYIGFAIAWVQTNGLLVAAVIVSTALLSYITGHTFKSKTKTQKPADEVCVDKDNSH